MWPDTGLFSYPEAQRFADARLEKLVGIAKSEIHKLRHNYSLHQIYKCVDTCAAEFATDTAYMYSTYEEKCESNSLPTAAEK